MTTEQRKEQTDNELIAEFMGGESYTGNSLANTPIEVWSLPSDVSRVYSEIELQFHTSWDWLMQPCQKLMTLFKSMDNNETKFDDRVQFNFIRGHIERAIWNYLYSSGSIIDVHSELAKAIKWYNSQAEYKR